MSAAKKQAGKVAVMTPLKTQPSILFIRDILKHKEEIIAD